MPLYAVTIFVSAFLLFLVQPLIAKQIVPWFGGSAAVWTTCLVFFQCVLLAGYAYADMLVRLRARTQAIVHTALAVLACATLPIIPSAALKPVDASDPSGRILLLLTATIGLPYLLVSTTGPLVQSWFARAYAHDPRSASVYRLFALSNLASLAALLAYPFAVEPFFAVRTQSIAWSGVFVAFAALVVATAWATERRTRSSATGAAPRETEAPTDAPPRVADYALWLALAGFGTLFLLVVTAHITQNVASVPFLWIVPLSLYLLTFILCFEGRIWYRRAVFWPLALLALPAMAWALGADRGVMDIGKAIPLFCIGLFVVCMFCHGELVRAKPAPRYLTRFYLMIALGGAIGGLFVGLVAPRVFVGMWEFPIALIALAAITGLVMRRTSAWLLLPALASLVAAAWFGWRYVDFMRDDAVYLTRNFYGALRVKQTGPIDEPDTMRRLMHGVIMHGEQFVDAARSRMPTSYYGVDSGAGLALRLSHPKDQRVGIIGLGAGTTAAYGDDGDVFHYYEINPQVLEVARGWFTFLPSTRARVETSLGDARLSLEREAPQRFDVLIVDAFSSDAIPVHLMTREALAVYRKHMAPDGVIAFHVTNRYLDLAPVVQQLADDAGLEALAIEDRPVMPWLSQTDYVLVTDRSNRAFIDHPLVQAHRVEIEPIAGLRLWTDDYNNLFKIVRRRP